METMRNGQPEFERARPRGSTLVAVVVTVMIIAALAAVALPVLQGAKIQDDANRTATMLVSLDSSLESNATAASLLRGMCVEAQKCPHLLSSLVIPITLTTQICNAPATYNATQVADWLLLGPYSGYVIVPGHGLKTPLGWVHDTLTRLGGSSFELHIDSLTLDQATYLDIAIDGSSTPTTLKLHYAEQPAIFTATGQHRYLARYIPPAGGSGINC